MGNWRYSSIVLHFGTDGTGQLLEPAALPPGKEASVPIALEAGLDIVENLLPLPGIELRFLGHPVRRPRV
jgi:hypothetical protein